MNIAHTATSLAKTRRTFARRVHLIFISKNRRKKNVKREAAFHIIVITKP